MTKKEHVYARACVKALGAAIGSVRPLARELEVPVKREREIWDSILRITADGGGKL